MGIAQLEVVVAKIRRPLLPSISTLLLLSTGELGKLRR
jgi:hypothetical protein